MPKILTDSTTAASCALSAGTTMPRYPGLFREHGHRKRAAHGLDAAVERELAHDEEAGRLLLVMIPSAISMPIAIGRSKAEPSFLMSAGARFTTTCFRGKSKPVFLSAARTRSLLSLTAASGRPTVAKKGKAPARDVDFDFYRVGVDAKDRGADDFGKHKNPSIVLSSEFRVIAWEQ